MSKIELKHIDKFYGKNHILKDVNLTIEDGDFMTLLGPSGCGKTTTLRVVSGLEKPQNGTIYIDGKEIVNAAEAHFAPPSERGLNLVFQSYALWPHMTVYENVAFVLQVQKWEKSGIETQVRKALAMMQIEEYRDRYPSELSGGQQQRVAIARAIVSNPRVLLLDEPLSNLDAKLRLEMRSELKRLHRELGTTMIYVTHDQVEALTLSTRIAVFSEGEIVQTDTPVEIYMNPANEGVARLIGNPKSNLIPAVARADGTRVRVSGVLGDSVLPWGAFLPGEEITGEQKCLIGLRPEHIAAGSPGEGPEYSVLTSMLAGSETLIEAQREGERILLKQLGFGNLRAGEPVYPVFSPDHINIFREDNGKLIKRALA